MKGRLILAAALGLLALACFTYGSGNIWAAGFKDADFAEYIHKATVLVLTGAVLLVSSVVLLSWCGVNVLRAKARTKSG